MSGYQTEQKDHQTKKNRQKAAGSGYQICERKGLRSDCHMHTEFSTDSDAPVRDMLEEAVRRGMDGVCVTDHLDLDFPEDEGLGPDAFQLDLDRYFRTLTSLREEYRGRLDVRIGVELGLQEHLGKAYRDIAREHPFDFIIGSLHLVRGTDPYNREIFREHTDAEVYREAFLETAQCLDAVEDFDALGHLDYVVRYGARKEEAYSYQRFADEIDGILKRLIASGKGLEMNMGGIRCGLGFPNPHPDVLKRYRELGGEIVTVGADAHRPEHIALAFREGADILRECGFRYYAEYIGRKPVFRKI